VDARSKDTRGQQPPRDRVAMARANRRTAILLGLIAFGIYSWFIVRQVMRSQGEGG
jgi:hypothetical protein